MSHCPQNVGEKVGDFNKAFKPGESVRKRPKNLLLFKENVRNSQGGAEVCGHLRKK